MLQEKSNRLLLVHSHKKSGTVIDRCGILFIAGRGLPGDRATVFAGVRGGQRSRLCRLLVAHLGYLLDLCILQVRPKILSKPLGSSQTQIHTNTS